MPVFTEDDEATVCDCLELAYRQMVHRQQLEQMEFLSWLAAEVPLTINPGPVFVAPPGAMRPPSRQVIPPGVIHPGVIRPRP